MAAANPLPFPETHTHPNPAPEQTTSAETAPWCGPVLDLLAEGASITAAMRHVGYSVSAFHKTCKRHPEFRLAANRARNAYRAKVAEDLHESEAYARMLVDAVQRDEQLPASLRLRAALAILNRKPGRWLPSPIRTPDDPVDTVDTVDTLDALAEFPDTEDVSQSDQPNPAGQATHGQPARNTMDTVDTVDIADTVDTMDETETMDRVCAIDTLGRTDTIDTPHTVDKMEIVDATDTMDTDASAPPTASRHRSFPVQGRNTADSQASHFCQSSDHAMPPVPAVSNPARFKPAENPPRWPEVLTRDSETRAA